MQLTADQKVWKVCDELSIKIETIVNCKNITKRFKKITQILFLQKIIFLDMKERCTEGSKVSCSSKVPSVISWKSWTGDWTRDVNPFPCVYSDNLDFCLVIKFQNDKGILWKWNEFLDWKSNATLHLGEFKTIIAGLASTSLYWF